MNQQSPDPDVFLEPDGTRVVETLDVAAPDSPSTRRIRIEPQEASITLRDGETRDGAVVKARDAEGDLRSTLDSRGGPGRLDLRNEAGLKRVEMRTDRGAGSVRVLGGRSVTTAFSSLEGRGRLEVNGDEGINHVWAGSEPIHNEMWSGVIEVKDTNAHPRVTLDARDAALELESASGQYEPLGADLGGGDLVVQDWLDEGKRDIYVHATSDGDSGYGLGDENRPRIVLDGPDATVELGRGELGKNREKAAGRIKLRYDMGQKTNTLLEVGTDHAGTSGEDRAGEVTLRRDDQGTLEDRGTVGSEERGLRLDDGTGTTKMVIPTDASSTPIRTKENVEVTENTIDWVGPSFEKTYFSVEQGATAQLELVLSDGDTTTVQIGYEGASGYELRGTLEADPDVNVTLLFDTAAAGSPDDDVPTVRTVEDAIWERSYETQLSGDLDVGEYDLSLEDTKSGQYIFQALSVLAVEAPS